MSDTDQIGVPEVWRGVQAIRGDIKALAEQVALRPDWEDLRRAELALGQRIQAEVDMRAMERHTADKAIQALEEWNTWAIRLLAGGAATGILGYIISQALQ